MNFRKYFRRRKPNLSLEELISHSERGDVDAKFDLACFYLGYGGGITDYEKATVLLGENSVAGDVNSQEVLGDILSGDRELGKDKNGNEITINIDRAIHWYKLAAENGSKLAKVKLVLLAKQGILIDGVDIESYEEEALKDVEELHSKNLGSFLWIIAVFILFLIGIIVFI